MFSKKCSEVDGGVVVVAVVLTLGSHDVVNQVDRRYLTFCHRHSSPSFKEDREVGEDRL